MPTNVNITILMDAEMKQLAAVKDSAKDVIKALSEPPRPSTNWIKFTGANGREIHLARAVLVQIAVVNEVIVQQEQFAPETPKQKILVPELRPGNN